MRLLCLTNPVITGPRNDLKSAGKYPLLCGENSGHHIYLNTEGRASTDLTFLLNSLQEQLYNCPDKFNVLNTEPDGLMRGFSNPAVNINGGFQMDRTNFLV